MLIIFIVSFVGGFISVFIGDTDFNYRTVVADPLESFIMMLLFQPLFTALGVTILSNYYQCAMRSGYVTDEKSNDHTN